WSSDVCSSDLARTRTRCSSQKWPPGNASNSASSIHWRNSAAVTSAMSTCSPTSARPLEELSRDHGFHFASPRRGAFSLRPRRTGAAVPPRRAAAVSCQGAREPRADWREEENERLGRWALPAARAGGGRRHVGRLAGGTDPLPVSRRGVAGGRRASDADALAPEFQALVDVDAGDRNAALGRGGAAPHLGEQRRAQELAGPVV